MKTFIPAVTVERLHLFTGAVLILAGLLSYRTDSLGSMLSWCIFGAMYISMSDIGECRMCCTEKASHKHRTRVAAAYLGAGLSVWLLVTLLG